MPFYKTIIQNYSRTLIQNYTGGTDRRHDDANGDGGGGSSRDDVNDFRSKQRKHSNNAWNTNAREGPRQSGMIHVAAIERV